MRKLILGFGLLTLLNTSFAQQQLNRVKTVSHLEVAPAARPNNFSVVPAIVDKSAKVLVDIERESWATLEIRDVSGEVVLEQQMALSEGSNAVPLFFVSKLRKGSYTTALIIEDRVCLSKFEKE